MKRLLALAPAALILTACGGGSDIAATPRADETSFIMHVRSMDNPYLDIASDSELISVGYAICSRMDEGRSVTSITDEMNAGLSNDDNAYQFVASLVAGAVTDLCREHYDRAFSQLG